jgi:hypothetical protein
MAEHKGKIDVEIAKSMESDAYDAYEKKAGPNERSLCGSADVSPRGIPEWDWGSFFPGGTVQAKAVDAAMAEQLQLWAAMGHPCAPDFVADTFLAKHSEYEWMRGLLRDMEDSAWEKFSSASELNLISSPSRLARHERTISRAPSFLSIRSGDARRVR